MPLNYLKLVPMISFAKKRCALILFSFISICSQSQHFSVLTCSQGDEIYSTFGHSAIRYQDSSQGIDWVYNYGLFEFSDPNFIPKFCMGKLDYMVGKESFQDFMAQYVYQRRTVKEQTLSLSDSQRNKLLQFLEWNILPENKYYRYDFLFNNCATKIIEILEKNCPDIHIRYLAQKESERLSFRNLIHRAASHTVPWIDWGMDLALGSSTDRKATDKEYCFLPEFVHASIHLSQNKTKRLISNEKILYQGDDRKTTSSFYETPTFMAILILCIALIYAWRPSTWSRIVMGMVFVGMGIGGFVIGFEWFFTEHTVTKMNWNIGWLNPLALCYGISLILKKDIPWLEKTIQYILIFSFFIKWISGQEFHIASLILFVSALVFSSVKINLKGTQLKTFVKK